MADILCVDLGAVNELDEAELAARGYDFGDGTVGREATAAGIAVLPILGEALGAKVAGTVTSLVLIYLSPTIQIDVLHHATAPFPLRNPGLISMPLAVLTGIGASLLWPDREAEARFVEVERRVHFGA